MQYILFYHQRAFSNRSQVRLAIKVSSRVVLHAFSWAQNQFQQDLSSIYPFPSCQVGVLHLWQKSGLRCLSEDIFSPQSKLRAGRIFLFASLGWEERSFHLSHQWGDMPTSLTSCVYRGTSPVFMSLHVEHGSGLTSIHLLRPHQTGYFFFTSGTQAFLSFF